MDPNRTHCGHIGFLYSTLCTGYYGFMRLLVTPKTKIVGLHVYYTIDPESKFQQILMKM